MTIVPHIIENQRQFGAAGYGLGTQETMHVYYAVKTFLEGQKNIGQCRFWGKVIGWFDMRF